MNTDFKNVVNFLKISIYMASKELKKNKQNFWVLIAKMQRFFLTFYVLRLLKDQTSSEAQARWSDKRKLSKPDKNTYPLVGIDFEPQGWCSYLHNIFYIDTRKKNKDPILTKQWTIFQYWSSFRKTLLFSCNFFLCKPCTA